MLIALALAFVASLVVAIAMILTLRHHAHITLDTLIGVQKLHSHSVMRIGGLALLIGLLLGSLALPQDIRMLWLTLLVSSVPAFAFGLLEDMTHRISAKVRLAATLLSALLFSLTTGYYLTYSDLPGLDWLLGFTWFAIPLTAIVIAGVTHSFNIIDGVNGLCLSTGAFAFIGLAVIAAQYGDIEILAICLLSLGALSGLFLLNFPFGLIFLGDSGAYLIGFFLAATAIMLSLRHPDISPLTGLLGLSYPITETLVSIHRRLLRMYSHPAKPDRLHLHSLLFRSRARRLALKIGRPEMRNPITSVLIWPLPILSVSLMVLFHTNPLALLASLTGMVLLYILIYRRVALLPKPPQKFAETAIRANK